MTASISAAAIDRRFNSKFVVNDETGCWEWTAGLQSCGYGAFWPRRKMVLAHRFAWERVHGAIPDGLWIDHLCLNKRCVNTAHLELVTPAENTRRGDALVNSAATQRAKTHCRNGHAYTGRNLVIRRRAKNGRTYRACRICCCDSARRHREKRAV